MTKHDDAALPGQGPERDTCPTCSSEDVVHFVIGMPASSDDVEGSPEWERWVGCIHPGYDRECRTCGATWSSPEDYEDLDD
ncbi:hypothetical protein NODU109028_17485 [Nocardioides dubius]|uniref:Uncharacterized protein n=1 Tax=Nocardioides dubius TaxID=317019 RepID=A0ABP4E6S7_9ACTN